MAVGKPALVHIPPPTGMECEALISEVKTEKKQNSILPFYIFLYNCVAFKKETRALYPL